MAAKRTRACHILASTLVRARAKDGFVPRQTLLNALLRDGRYASTAEAKLSGYMNDIRVYENGDLDIVKDEHSRLIHAYRLKNAKKFDPKTGFNVDVLKAQGRIDEIPKLTKTTKVVVPPSRKKTFSGPRTDTHITEQSEQIAA